MTVLERDHQGHSGKLNQDPSSDHCFQGQTMAWGTELWVSAIITSAYT